MTSLVEIMPILIAICGTILLITLVICGTKIILKGFEIDKIRALKKEENHDAETPG